MNSTVKKKKKIYSKKKNHNKKNTTHKFVLEPLYKTDYILSVSLKLYIL